jgi:hypothetical protein
MLTCAENGTRFTCEYGDIDESFYNRARVTAIEQPAVFVVDLPHAI